MSESLTSSRQILEEVKRIITQPRNKDNDVISLYDVINFIKIMNNQYEKMEQRYILSFEKIIKTKYNYPYIIIIQGFNYEEGELIVDFGDRLNNLRKIIFKKDENLYIDKAYTPEAYELFKILEDDISKLYDEFIRYKEFKTNSKYGLKSTNSRFLVDISHNVVNVYNWFFYPIFELSFENSTNKYKTIFNLELDLYGIHAKDEELFKKIFVKISDCPEWMQEQLYEIRQNQLAEEQKIEDEEKYKQMKRQK